MQTLHGIGQFLLFFIGNGVPLLALAFLSRGLRHAFPKRVNEEAKKPQAPLAVPPIEVLPDFSPAVLHLLVRDTPKPKPRTEQGPSPSIFFLMLPSICMSLLPTPTHAQTPVPAMTLPPLHVDAPNSSCVDVEVEGTRQSAFDCLNEQLKATAAGAAPSDPNAALNAVVGNAEPNKVGTFSHTGESIRMGSNFGKSAFPQRSPAPVYANPLTAGVKP